MMAKISGLQRRLRIDNSDTIAMRGMTPAQQQQRHQMATTSSLQGQ
jgi:hypothetical protein